MKMQIYLMGALLSSGLLLAQVGINNTNPQATLDILSKGNTASTKAFKINNSDNTEIVTITDEGKVGIGISIPTDKLTVNGTLRIMDTDALTAPITYPLAVDANGLIGKSGASPTTQLAYFSTTGTVYSAPANSANLTAVNNGTVIAVPIILSHAILNTIGFVMGANNSVKTTQEGYYQIGAAINFALSMSQNQRFFVAVNIQKSTDGGTTWQSLIGIRPIIQSASTSATPGNFNYPQVISPIITKLYPNDLLRLVFYRTTSNGTTLQGNSVAALSITEYSSYGIIPYNLSIVKL